VARVLHTAGDIRLGCVDRRDRSGDCNSTLRSVAGRDDVFERDGLSLDRKDHGNRTAGGNVDDLHWSAESDPARPYCL